tara:strand:- start:688 stop:834 length:147 start_codon:yes stop_codon:yes gene_type:complete
VVVTDSVGNRSISIEMIMPAALKEIGRLEGEAESLKAGGTGKCSAMIP